MLAMDSAEYNIHWIPVNLLCRPCTRHYTIVAKIDTIERDSRKTIDIFIFTINCLFRFIRRRKTLGHEEEETTKTLENIHKTKNGSDGNSTLLPSQRFFSQLERKEVEGLIQKYQIDLEMWGYSPQKYLEFAKIESCCWSASGASLSAEPLQG